YGRGHNGDCHRQREEHHAGGLAHRLPPNEKRLATAAVASLGTIHMSAGGRSDPVMAVATADPELATDAATANPAAPPDPTDPTPPAAPATAPARGPAAHPARDAAEPARDAAGPARDAAADPARDAAADPARGAAANAAAALPLTAERIELRRRELT